LRLFQYIAILICFTSVAQTKLSESLIAIHFGTNSKDYSKQLIYRYNFVNHSYTGKELIMTVDGKKDGKDYLRFDEGENTLYKDRYLISPKGVIIDLQEKTILHDAPSKLVKCTNDSVIFFINDIFSGPYYSYYNLETRKYADISDSKFKPLIGQTLEFDQQKSPYKLYYTPQGKSKVLLMEDAGHGGVSSNGNKLDIPVCWIDNETFIFPYIKITDLEGNIIKYNLSTKSQKSIGTFNSTAKGVSVFSFNKTKTGLQEFTFKDKLYLINPTKETMLPIFYKDFNPNFSVSVEAKVGVRLVYHKGVEVGKNNFELVNFKTSENYAAMICNLKMGESINKRNLSIYSVFKGKWESIYTDNVVSLVGWIKQ